MLGHELAPVPTSMFDDTGDMTIAKSKSTLKNIHDKLRCLIELLVVQTLVCSMAQQYSG